MTIATSVSCVAITIAVEEGDTELLLENKATKNLFLDDIYELQEFLARRKVETASEGMSLIQVRGHHQNKIFDWGECEIKHFSLRWEHWMNSLQWSVG